MAPPKVVKKPPKAVVNPIVKPITKLKKRKNNYQNFSSYVFKLLRTVSPVANIGISRQSMVIMNNFVNDLLEKIAAEAGQLVAHNKRSTLSGRDIMAAAKLVMPEELAKHANIEAMKALQLYNNSRPKE